MSLRRGQRGVVGGGRVPSAAHVSSVDRRKAVDVPPAPLVEIVKALVEFARLWAAGKYLEAIEHLFTVLAKLIEHWSQDVHDAAQVEDPLPPLPGAVTSRVLSGKAVVELVEERSGRWIHDAWTETLRLNPFDAGILQWVPGRWKFLLYLPSALFKIGAGLALLTFYRRLRKYRLVVVGWSESQSQRDIQSRALSQAVPRKTVRIVLRRRMPGGVKP